jgi:hypothetical protein
MSGWFGFRTPEDLLEKLERDLEKLHQNPGDADTAFNFFITAWSLIDWLHPNDHSICEALRHKNPILQACAHLADGSKHLQLKNLRHVSIRNTVRGAARWAWPFRMSPGERPVSATALFVHLEGEAAGKFGSFPSALDLAKATGVWLKAYMASLS